MQLTSAPSPAQAFIQRNQFLVRPEQGEAAALELRATAPDTVELVVGDPFGEGDDHMYADTAATVLEPVVEGVKLIVKTPDGYVGEAGWFSGDEQYFANALPGLTSQAAEVAWDRNGDGTIDEDAEAAFLFPVASQADADRLDPLIRPKIGDYDVVFEVDSHA